VDPLPSLTLAWDDTYLLWSTGTDDNSHPVVIARCELRVVDQRVAEIDESANLEGSAAIEVLGEVVPGPVE
jgi:hypothetical protein